MNIWVFKLIFPLLEVGETSLALQATTNNLYLDSIYAATSFGLSFKENKTNMEGKVFLGNLVMQYVSNVNLISIG